MSSSHLGPMWDLECSQSCSRRRKHQCGPPYTQLLLVSVLMTLNSEERAKSENYFRYLKRFSISGQGLFTEAISWFR